jgi:TolA-binding protein
MQMQQMQMQQMQMQMQQMQKTQMQQMQSQTQMQQMQSQTQMQPMQSMPKAPPSGLGPHSSPPSAVPNRPTALPNGAVPADAAYAKPLANVREDASGSPTGRAEKHPLSAPTGGAARIIMPRYNEPRASSYPYVVNRGR